MNGGVVLGSVKHLDDDARAEFTVESLSEDAVKSSEIEGEVLSRESVQSSIRRQLGLGAESHRTTPAEQGIAEMMVDLYRTAGAPLSQAMLCSWHGMLMRGRADIREVAQYRTHPEPMQVVSGKVYEPMVHFEAPPSAEVPRHMAGFLEWFSRTAPSGPDPLPALTRAGIAHLYFESIHPFEDGNGRIGRAISETALAQALGAPTLTALAATILRRRREYYDVLGASNKHNEISGWLAWFAGVAIEAQQRTQAQIAFLLDKARLLDGVRDRLNQRQLKVLLRVFREGPEGFRGGLRAGNYVSIAKTSPATARRDLAQLVKLGALTRTGERRHARYHPAVPLRPVPTFSIDADGNVVAA